MWDPQVLFWTGQPVTSGLTEEAAQVAQDGTGLVQGEVSILELGELPKQLRGGVSGTALSEELILAAPTIVLCPKAHALPPHKTP